MKKVLGLIISLIVFAFAGIASDVVATPAEMSVMSAVEMTSSDVVDIAQAVDVENVYIVDNLSTDTLTGLADYWLVIGTATQITSVTVVLNETEVVLTIYTVSIAGTHRYTTLKATNSFS